MCFYNDYDWTAEVVHKGDEDVAKPTQCVDCERMMTGKMICTLMQEHEECHAYGCEDECTCDEPDFGETFTCHQCLDCIAFRKAINAVEAEAGCPHRSREPANDFLESLEASNNQDKYFERAERDAPELVANGYLAWLKERVDR